MAEIKLHAQSTVCVFVFWGFFSFSLSQKDIKGSKTSDVNVCYQKPRIVTKSYNRKAQKKRWISW